MEKSELDFGMIVAHPGISALNDKETKFGGYLQVNEKIIELTMDFEENKVVYINLKENLKQFENEINETIKSCNFKHPLHILNKLIQLLKEHVVVEDFNVNLCSRVLKEYYEFNQYYHLNVHSSYLSPDLKTIKIGHLDEYRRIHNIEITTSENPTFTITNIELPEGDLQLQGDDSLVELYKNFINIIKSYQDFFNLMDEIDKTCWVLDPEMPTRKANYRRISLTDKVSVIATFNASNPNEMPKMIFMGPQNLTSVFRERQNKNIVNWDVNMHPIQEILKLLELESFPDKPNETEVDNDLLVSSEECCICFALRLDNKLPEIICPNTSCNRYFHTNCLYQWFCSLQCRKVCEEIIGECPSCEKVIFINTVFHIYVSIFLVMIPCPWIKIRKKAAL